MRLGSLILVLALVVMASAVMAAPVGASVTAGADQSDYTVSAGTAGVNAGQIREVNITVQTPSNWWAGFMGTITEKEVLGNLSASQIMYEWTLSAPNSGWVYITNNTAFDWANTATATTADVNAQIWQAASIPNDVNVETTFRGSCSGAGHGTIPVGAGAVTTNDGTGNPYWETCIFKDATKGYIAFAAAVDTEGHTAFNGVTVNYQALVAAKPAASGGATYYFFKG
ncbi:MAG: hypothetical protein PWQ11_586 [Candidatus Diapherotrites archaeon]|nr:hypothetical protein [Candidatus Diapherotrites archaeon]